MKKNISSFYIKLLILVSILFLILFFIYIFYFDAKDTSQKEVTNPESVISPVENILTTSKVEDKRHLAQLIIYNLLTLEKMMYNWNDIFDIFTLNTENQHLHSTIKTSTLENIAKDIRDPNPKFFKGSSDELLKEYGDLIKEESKYYGLDWRLILAMIKQESAFIPDAVSHAGAFGFMQIMPKTGSKLEQTLFLEDYRSPKNNLIAGIYYYATLIARYHAAGDTNKYKFALAAYNAGSGRVEDAMSIAYYNGDNYWDWDIIAENLKLLSPQHDSLHQKIWSSKPPNGTFLNWKEPYYYVRNIIYFWDEYKKIYPLPEDKEKKKTKKTTKKKS